MTDDEAKIEAMLRTGTVEQRLDRLALFCSRLAGRGSDVAMRTLDAEASDDQPRSE